MSYKYSREKRWETTWRRSPHNFAQNYRVDQSRFYCSERVKAKKYSHSKHKLNVISYVAGNGINITDTEKEPKHRMSTSHLLRRMYILKDLHQTVEWRTHLVTGQDLYFQLTSCSSQKCVSKKLINSIGGQMRSVGIYIIYCNIGRVGQWLITG